MARIRSIKPEFFTSVQIVNCVRDARLLFVGMWCFCDDAGRHPASPRRLKMEIFPGDEDVTIELISRWVRELVREGLLSEYVVEEQAYWQVTGWHHQRIDQPTVKHPSREGDFSCEKPRRLGGKQRQLAYKKLCERDGEMCRICGSLNNLAVDHIQPLSRGGTNDLDNLQLLCKPCNNEKYVALYATGTRQVLGDDSPPESSRVESSRVESNGVDVKKEQSAEADDTLGGIEQLRDWLGWWNRLQSAGLVSSQVNEERPSDAVRRAWKRCQENREVRELLAQREKLEDRIRKSHFLREGWFRLEKLFGAKNRDGEFIVRKLLEGGYEEHGGCARNGKHDTKPGPGQRFDPASGPGCEIGNF